MKKESLPKKDPRYEDGEWLKQVISYIDDHLDNGNLHVSDIAFASLTSERQLYRRLKQLTGLTPNQLVRKRRMRKARQLLNEGEERSLRYIAARVGFHRPDYFAKLFQQEYRVHPDECCRN